MTPALPDRLTRLISIPEGRLTTRRVARLASVGQRKIGNALDAMEQAERINTLRNDLATSPADMPPQMQKRSSRRWVVVAVNLTILNTVAVVLMLTLPDETATTPNQYQISLAILFGVLLASAELALASALGRKLQTDRRTAASNLHAHRTRSDPNIPFEAAALGLICGLVAWLIYLWTQIRIGDTHPRLAAVLGVCLAVQAWAAPWLLVADIAGTLPTRHSKQDIINGHRQQLDHKWEGKRLTASLALLTARSALRRAEQCVDEATQLGCGTPRGSWSHHLNGLAVGITEPFRVTISDRR